MKKIVQLTLLCFLAMTNISYAQYENVDFEPGGLGASWTWIMDQNADNPPLEFIANPVSGGINSTPNVAKFIARLAGQPWALAITDDLDEFQFDATNTTVKIMVYKPVISNVGMKFEGPSGAFEILIPNTVINQWEELTFDFSGQIGNTYNRLVIIPDFDFARAQENIVYFDNIQIPEGNIAPPAEPTVGAPTPTHNEVADNVISIYSDSYTNVGGTDFNPNWGQNTVVTEENIVGNNTLKYANLNYQGTVLGTSQDVSGHDFLHVDFWTTDATTLQFFLISPGPVEIAYTLNVIPNQWNSVEIPLSAFSPPVNLADVFQFKVEGNGTVYFDNYYFYEQTGMTAAPIPIHDEIADNVISIFSDSYTNVAGTNLNPNWGQNTVVTEENIGGNNTLKYANLNYQGTVLGTSQDVSGHDFLHVDFYTADATFLNFFLISPGPAEIAYSLTVTPNQWNSIEIPLSAFSPPVNLSDVFQFKVEGNGTVYFDNFYFYEGMTGAPIPIHDEVTNNVISIFSDSYTNVGGTDFNPNWGQNTVVTQELIGGNNTLKYANLNYQGTVLGTSQDVSGHDFLHVDFYTADATFLNFFLISPGPAEIAYSLPVIPNQWNSIEIPLSAFTPPVNLSDVFQFKVDGDGTVYFDNFYFYEEVAPTVSIELCVDLSCQASVTAASVFGDFNGWSANANFVTDPDGDGIYCATVDMDPGVQEYKFFTQETGPEEFATPETCTTNGPTNINREITVVAGTPQSVTYAWETCNAVCVPIPTVDITLCVDMSCLGAQAPSVFGGFNGWNAGSHPVSDPDGDGVYCATVNMQVGDQYFKFFDQIQGPENFTSVINGCTAVDGVNINRIITVVENQPQTLTYAFNTCDPTCVKPEEAAPTPIHDEADNCVISIFSDSYTDVAGTDFNPNWGQQTATTFIDINGNNTLRYGNLNYQGTQFTSQNVADHDFIHVDFWTSDATDLNFYLISPGNEIGYALTGDIINEQWVSVDIPLSAFDPPVNLSDVFQFKVVGNGTVYFDNYYFWQEAVEWFADTDMDGYGDPNSSIFSCSPPANYVLDNTDCNDMAPGENPGAVDIPCNGIDEDCVDGDYIPAEAVVTFPSLPSSISCADAVSFVAPNATYTNGESGIYEISGTMIPQVSNFWSTCGGTIVVTYADVTDLCGNTIFGSVTTITVQPAPLPTITVPVLANSLSCEAAQSYAPPTTTFDNGESGVCNISGTVSADLNHFYDACGGTLEVIYSGLDDCGRNLVAVVVVINVNPAPAPTIDIPTFPASLSCSDAESFTAPFTPYDNGMTGVCNISGLIQPFLLYNVDECNGGTMTIIYNGADDCGNPLFADPITIQVAPAAVAELKAPDEIPNTIYCWEANGNSPGNATYDNGETGSCQNSGEIAPVITEFWNSCDGGFIIYSFDGVDNCGNELTPIVLTVSVLPNELAPQGECAPVTETLDIADVPGPDDLGYYLDQVTAGYYALCGEMIATVIDDTGAPECSGEGVFERIYTVEITDDCGNVAGTCTITFSGSCNANYCTMTQKFYGNPDDELNGMSSEEIINTLLDSGNNPITIGEGNCAIVIDDAACIQTMMNSYGPAISLPPGFASACSETNNSLVNQMVTTILNIRYNESLNPSGSLDFGDFALSAACMNIPGWMLAELPDNPTVNDLLNYANDFMACQCNGTCGAYQPNMAELTNLFWGLNSRFNNCHVPGPCGLQSPDIPGDVNLVDGSNNSIGLYPNPTRDFINLEVSKFIGLPAVIEIFDTRGAKLGEKTYQAIDQGTLELDVQKFENGLYWFSINIEGQDQIIKKFIVNK